MCFVFLDDLRDPPGDYRKWVVVRSFYEFVGWCEFNSMEDIEFMSFDHDLGESYGRELNTGYDVALWMAEMDYAGEAIFNENFRYRVHSSNPAGAKNIRNLMDRHFRRKGEKKSREVLNVPKNGVIVPKDKIRFRFHPFSGG